MSPSTIRPGPRRADQHAVVIAEQVTETWFGHHGSGHLEIPLAVVAALALIWPQDEVRNDLAVELIGLSNEQLCQVIRQLWRWYLRCRPDLANRVWPLGEPWFDQQRPMSEPQVIGAAHVARAALTYDQLGLTGTWRRTETDLLGTVLAHLRPNSEAQARRQFYTPTEVCNLMARLLDMSEQESIHDPACGPGGMFRAAAHDMREAGRDPEQAQWVGIDSDRLAVACLAVNVLLWGLGWRVLLAVGDSLIDPVGALHRADAERRETLELAIRLRHDASGRAANRQLAALFDRPDANLAQDQADTEHDGAARHREPSQ